MCPAFSVCLWRVACGLWLVDFNGQWKFLNRSKKKWGLFTVLLYKLPTAWEMAVLRMLPWDMWIVVVMKIVCYVGVACLCVVWLGLRLVRVFCTCVIILCELCLLHSVLLYFHWLEMPGFSDAGFCCMATPLSRIWRQSLVYILKCSPGFFCIHYIRMTGGVGFLDVILTPDSAI